MIRVVGELSDREVNRISEVTSFVPRNRNKERGRGLAFGFGLYRVVFDGPLNGFAIVVEGLIA